MKEEKRRFAPPAVGGSSLLVIFAVLCLTVFALLALGTVQADGRLREASAEAVRGYYRADTEAERILALLRNGETPEGVALTNGEAGTVAASYSCRISDTQELAVEIAFEGNTPGDRYRIVRWQAVSTAEWVPDDSLTVWDGEFGE